MGRISASLAMLLLPGAICAAPESYTVDPRHTFPRWAVSHHGFSIHRGQFNATTGKMVVDWSAKSGNLAIDVETASIGTGDAEFDKVLRGENFFATEKHPKMTFRSTRMRFEGDALVEVSGDLTLLGVTRSVTFRVDGAKCGIHPVSKKALCGADVTGAIKRSEFGMKFGLPSVSDDIRLTIQFEAFKD